MITQVYRYDVQYRGGGGEGMWDDVQWTPGYVVCGHTSFKERS